MKRLTVFAAVTAIAYASSWALAIALAPVEVNDLVGKWRNVKKKDQIFTIVRSPDALTLVTPKYSDWEPLQVDQKTKTAIVRFTRKTTTADIQGERLDNSQDPAPESVVSDASGIVSESLVGFPKRTSHYFGPDCDLTMSVQWRGFHIQWNADGSPNPDGKIWWYKNPQPELKENYEQIRYAWPNLKRSVVETGYNGPSNGAGGVLNSYFTLERPAMQAYGEFGAALFKPMFSAVTGVVPAETFLGKIAESLFGTVVEKGLKGDLKASDIASVIAGKVFDKVLENVADREPFATIKAKLDKAIGADQTEALGGAAKDKAAALAGDKLTKGEVTQLDTYLQNQCRYQIEKLPADGHVSGGIVVADTQTGEATVWVFLHPLGEPASAVIGGTSVPEKGTLKLMHIQFSALQ